MFEGETGVGRSVDRTAHLMAQNKDEAPDEVRICVVAAENRRRHWEWVKWLPHAQHPRIADAAGPVRLIFSDATDLEEALGGELTDRPRFSREATPLYEAPHIVVVVDGARASGESMLPCSYATMAIRSICLRIRSKADR